MSRDKYFSNPYPDYTPENASTVIENKAIRANCRILTKLNEKWQTTLERFKYLELNDNTIYTGTSGFALLKMRKDSQRKESLEEIKQLLLLHRIKKKRHTFLCGDGGPLALAAIIESKLGNTDASQRYIKDLMAMKEDVLDPGSDMANEYLYGRAGYLYSILYVNKNIAPPPYNDTFIRQIIETILICGKDEAKAGNFKSPLMYQWHESYYLGAAHGISGILYLLLQVKEYLTESELHNVIKPTIDYLATLRFPSGNFPSSLGREKDSYVQWCHGAPGFVFLFSMAYKVFGDSKYLQLAVESGDVVWSRGLLRKGYSICHGVSGNAYCFLELYQTTSIRANCRILTKLNEKWQTTLERFKYLELNDNTIYTGTSGFAMLKMRKDSQRKESLEEIKQLLLLHRIKKKRHTFLCGDGGPLPLAAIIESKLGNTDASQRYIKDLMAMKEDVLDPGSDMANEYLYGRAGYLYSILYVNKNIAPPPYNDTFIRQIIETILICGKDEAKAGKFKSPLMYQWYESYYLGAAHGISGILYLLLQVKEYLTESELHNVIKPTIDYLATLRFPSGNFPSSLEKEKDSFVQWCHGAPGFVFLFSMAYKVFGDSKYLQLAVESGDVVWSRGLLRKGYSICHGVSGNAYCFLELYQTTSEEKHLYRAIKFAEWCLDYTKSHEEYSPDRPLSLYEGIAGPMYLLLDMQNPMEAKFPGFTL